MWKADGAESPIGLLAGRGDLPLLFAKAASSLKKRVILFGVEGLTDRGIENYVEETHFLGFGTLNGLPDLLKKTEIRKVVLAGGIPKREIYNPGFKPDESLKGLIQTTANKGDDHLLKAFEFFLKVKCGVSVIDSRTILKDLLAKKGVMTRRSPTEAELKDLKFGWQVAKGIGKMDIGQTVVVKNGIVLAVEALEGTDKAIRRGGKLGHGNAVVVKAAKPNQDLRFDLPCAGMETLDSLKAASSFVLGVEAGKTILLYKDRMLKTADEANISIVGLH